jgi:choline dehydrogenase
LAEHNISLVKDLPGIGTNLQDRIEMTVIWQMKQNYTLFKGCTFGDSMATDPCLQEWAEGGHENVYSSGPAVWAHAYKSDPALEYL